MFYQRQACMCVCMYVICTYVYTYVGTNTRLQIALFCLLELDKILQALCVYLNYFT